MLRSFALSLLAALLFVSCRSDEAKQQPYWNSVGYFQSEAKRLTDTHHGLYKNLMFDGQNQATAINEPDWKKELEPFMAIDLQKVSYRGRFDIDTVLNDGGYTVTYHATDSQTDLRYCRIGHLKERIVTVSAAFGKHNNLYQSERTFYYTPERGYSISGNQQVTLSGPVVYKINGRFYQQTVID